MPYILIPSERRCYLNEKMIEVLWLMQAYHSLEEIEQYTKKGANKIAEELLQYKFITKEVQIIQEVVWTPEGKNIQAIGLPEDRLYTKLPLTLADIYKLNDFTQQEATIAIGTLLKTKQAEKKENILYPLERKITQISDEEYIKRGLKEKQERKTITYSVIPDYKVFKCLEDPEEILEYERRMEELFGPIAQPD